MVLLSGNINHLGHTRSLSRGERIIANSMILFLYTKLGRFDATYSVTRLGDLLDFEQLFKALATINLPKSPIFLGNFCLL